MINAIIEYCAEHRFLVLILVAALSLVGFHSMQNVALDAIPDLSDPQVIIFDEPTVGLDVMTARTIVQFVRECRQQGKTVIFSTHVMSEAEKLCDTIGIIHDGKLLTEGTLAELRAQHAMQDLEDIFVKLVEARP